MTAFRAWWTLSRVNYSIAFVTALLVLSIIGAICDLCRN